MEFMYDIGHFVRANAPAILKTGGAALVSLVLAIALPETGYAATPPPNFTVAFIGDQSVSTGAVAVLELIRDEGADMVLHQGDLGYTLNALAWDQQIDATLGANFPYFGSIGNHDCLMSLPGCSGPGNWPDYQALLQARLDRIPGASCTGDLGVNAACTYEGIFFVLSGVGTSSTGHETFIADSLGASDSDWRICSWHKVDELMQVGFYVTEVPLSTYDVCRAGGAIIATGHQHHYSRTHLMSSFSSQTILSTSSELSIGNGQTIAFVSGLGGHSVRVENPTRAADPWWASVYTSTQGAQFGALFCSFNYQSVANRAHCYFKDIGGVVADEFDLVSLFAPPPTPTEVPSMSGYALAILMAASLLAVLLAPNPDSTISVITNGRNRQYKLRTLRL